MLLLSHPRSRAGGRHRRARRSRVRRARATLYFTTSRPHVSNRRLDLGSGGLTTVVAVNNNANGMTLGHDGRLIVCEQGSLTEPAPIVALDPQTGARRTLVDN